MQELLRSREKHRRLTFILTDFRPLRIAMLRAEKVDELMAILDEIVDKYGK